MKDKELGEPRGRLASKKISSMKMDIVEELYSKGYSLHQMRKFLKFKSVNSVVYYLKKLRKVGRLPTMII
jgi:hypothetical protein